MSRRLHAEIAGAGFAGLTVASALVQRGWSVCAHEQNSVLREFGGGIFMWDQGLRVLAALGAYDTVLAGSHRARIFEMRTERNAPILSEHFSAADGMRMLTMTRQHLYAPLLRPACRAGAEVRPDSAVAGAIPKGELILVDGTRLAADLVVGCDGVIPRVRESLGLLCDKWRSSEGAIRIMVPRRALDGLADDADHAIEYLAADGRRVLYVPCEADFVNVSLGSKVDDAGAMAIPARKELWITSFPDLAPLLGRIGEEELYDRYETIKFERWSRGCASLIGDAAHGMPPSLGQGAGCAIMNALGLAVALRECADVKTALETWECRERPLAEHTQDLARRHGERSLGFESRKRWTEDSVRTALHVPTGPA